MPNANMKHIIHILGVLKIQRNLRIGMFLVLNKFRTNDTIGIRGILFLEVSKKKKNMVTVMHFQWKSMCETFCRV